MRIEVSAKVREFSIYLPSTILCSREPHILSDRFLSDMPKIIYTHAGIIDSQRLYVNAWLSGFRVFRLFNALATLVCIRGHIGVANCWQV